MRTRSPLVVDVSELLEGRLARRPVSLSTEVADLEAPLAGVREPVRLDLVIEPMEGGVIVRGSIAGRYTGTCRRCLKPVGSEFDERVAEVYRPATDVWEEGYVVTEGTVDLERVIRDTVGLNLPVNPLCRPDCAGLCPRCGADLNEGPCGCPAEEIDPRWSALRDLRPDANR